MAVAMDVSWRGLELGSPSFLRMKRKPSSIPSWGGADPQKVLQLMMGQLNESRPTLDLLGNTANTVVDEAGGNEFIEIYPDGPLPSGWEKCLDLKSGKVYFVNRHTGQEMALNPRAYSSEAEMNFPSAPESLLTRDFLGSKCEVSVHNSTSVDAIALDGLDTDSKLPLVNLKQLWQREWVGAEGQDDVTDNRVGGLELKLDLVPNGQQQSVCTLEKVQMALRRSEKMMGKKLISNASNSLSDHSMSYTSPSSSTSSSTSTSSKPAKTMSSSVEKEFLDAARSNISLGLGTECDIQKMETLGGCKRCLTYVMLTKSNPTCPRCKAPVSLDFPSRSPRPIFKKPKLDRESA